MAVSDIAFTPVVKHAQAERGSRAIYEKVEQRGGWRDRIDSMLADFIAERDSFYLATAGADGQPYIQHRDQRVSSRLRWNRPKTPVPRPPLIAASDIRRLLAHAGGWAGTRLTPASWEPRTVATLQRLWSWWKRDVAQKVAGRIEIAAPGRFSSGQARRLAAEWVAIRAELDWARARATQGRVPETTLEPPGAERLRAALNAGRGAVLWFSSFSDSWLLFRGLADAGFRVQHLSRKTHGAPSGSRFSFWTLNRFQRLAEDAYLERRIVMDQRGVAGYARQILRALGANRPVTVRGDLSPTSEAVPAPLFGRTAVFPPGAPAFAHRSGAALLTVYCRRSGPFRYRIEIDEPVQATGSTRDAFVAAAVLRVCNAARAAPGRAFGRLRGLVVAAAARRRLSY